MADTVEIPEGHPGPHFPTLFVDGSLAATWSNGVAKVYWHRLDPNFTAGKPGSIQPVAQMVMGIPNFAATAVFFAHQLQRMIKAKLITAEEVEKLRGLYGPES